MAEGDLLRREKRKKYPVDERVEKRAAGAGAGGRPKAMSGRKAQQQRVAFPDDLGLRVALGSVLWLWERLSGWQQDQVAAAVKAELSQLAGLGVATERVPRLLAARLTGRLEETGGEALIKKPFGWLIGRGLVRRPSCSDRRCDDGTRLDTGGKCGNCGNVVHLRRGCPTWGMTSAAASLRSGCARARCCRGGGPRAASGAGPRGEGPVRCGPCG